MGRWRGNGKEESEERWLVAAGVEIWRRRGDVNDVGKKNGGRMGWGGYGGWLCDFDLRHFIFRTIIEE